MRTVLLEVKVERCHFRLQQEKGNLLLVEFDALRNSETVWGIGLEGVRDYLVDSIQWNEEIKKRHPKNKKMNCNLDLLTEAFNKLFDGGLWDGDRWEECQNPNCDYKEIEYVENHNQGSQYSPRR